MSNMWGERIMKGRERWAGKKAYYNLIHNDFPFKYESNIEELTEAQYIIYFKTIWDEFNDQG